MKVGATHKDIGAGAARLSSAGALKCMLRCQNLRNPYPVFYLSPGTARDNREEGEDNAKSAWPLMPWAAHVVQWPEQWAAKPQGGANPIKFGLSSD